MDRQRLLMIGVCVAALVWMVHLSYISPWLGDMDEARKEIDRRDLQFKDAKSVLNRQAHIKAEYDDLQKALTPVADASVASRFNERVREICSMPELQGFEVSSAPSQKEGDFIEHGVTTKFRLPWRPFVSLLERLKTDQGLLKVQRMTCTAKEKEDLVLVDMTLTTIERAPAAAGGRK